MMAGRVLLRRRTIPPLMVAATVVGGALLPAVAFAEAPEDSPKKPIYDDYEDVPLPRASTPTPSPFSETIPPTSLPVERQGNPHSPTPTERLAVQVRKARLFLYSHATKAEDAVNSAVDSAFNLEKSLTETIASLAPARESGEKLMPGLVYVLVAGMAGSIMSRNRNILLRASVPLALGIGAGWLVIPVTMGNVSRLAWTYEQRFPAVADTHIQARDNVQKTWRTARERVNSSKRYVDEKVTETRNLVEGWVKQGK